MMDDIYQGWPKLGAREPHANHDKSACGSRQFFEKKIRIHQYTTYTYFKISTT